MPLIPCPDCGREVSTAAPACVHCGRPLAESASPAAPASGARKPMAGIVTAVVLGLISIAWSFSRPTDSQNLEIRDQQQLTRSVQLLGNGVLIIGALLSLAGERRGHGIVRGTSVLMIGAVLLILLMGWDILRSDPELADGQGVLAVIMAVAGALWLAPWVLFLYLFRSSRYP